MKHRALYYLIAFPLLFLMLYLLSTGRSVEGLGIYLLAIAIGIAIFLVLRNVILWYYKIDHRIDQQKEIIRLLKKIAGEP